MAILLGLTAALGYGAGDFLAGLLSRRIHHVLVALIGDVVALGLTAAALGLTANAGPSSTALFWGAASGVGGGIGTVVLYRGLGRGRMGIVAPLSALGAAAIPVVVGVALGDRPNLIAWAGVILALPAIWLVSTSGDTTTDEPSAGQLGLAAGVADGLMAGVAFALLFVGLDLAGGESGLWPAAASQVAAVLVLAIVSIAMWRTLGARSLMPRDVVGAASVGVLGAIATIAYFLSTQTGLLSIVVVLASLYPAVTVVLAAVLLQEPIGRRQAIGLVLAGVAVLLIVLG